MTANLGLIPQDEDSWEAEYWDDFRAEFGTRAYIMARYFEGMEVTTVVDGQDRAR